MRINKKRINKLNDIPVSGGAVIYWMSRDQRVRDNWALLYAQSLAGSNPLIVFFNLVPDFGGATIRHYTFMLEGLKKVQAELKKKNIPLYAISGKPEENIPKFIAERGCGVLVTDFDPLKIKREWKEQVKRRIKTAFHEVDSHNIVPAYVASDKREYAAYTIRPRIKRKLEEFFTEFPKVRKRSKIKMPVIEWDELYESLDVDRSVSVVQWIRPGSEEAEKVLGDFISNRIERYSKESNNPILNAVSNMSPYLHFGQISAQRIALRIREAPISKEAKESYFEQLIVRRELSDNFCLYDNNYDSVECFPEWAAESLSSHRSDRREYIYSKEQFENGQTDDNLWNAAQREMLTRGKMHGYMRMYWAKKILEWTAEPEEAFDIAIYLNNRYELDGRDPNGYAGVAWAIGGVHDRAWKERKIFGKVRYMSYEGCRRKFDVEEYIRRFGD